MPFGFRGSFLFASTKPAQAQTNYATQTYCCTESEWRFPQIGNTFLHITIGIIIPFHLEFSFATEPLTKQVKYNFWIFRGRKHKP